MTSRVANLSRLIFSLSLATGLLCAGANASAQTTASVTIPFAFSAENQYVAAGTYKVELLSDRFLSLRNIATNQTQVLMVRPDLGRPSRLAADSSLPPGRIAEVPSPGFDCRNEHAQRSGRATQARPDAGQEKCASGLQH